MFHPRRSDGLDHEGPEHGELARRFTHVPRAIRRAHGEGNCALREGIRQRHREEARDALFGRAHGQRLREPDLGHLERQIGDATGVGRRHEDLDGRPGQEQVARGRRVHAHRRQRVIHHLDLSCDGGAHLPLRVGGEGRKGRIPGYELARNWDFEIAGGARRGRRHGQRLAEGGDPAQRACHRSHAHVVVHLDRHVQRLAGRGLGRRHGAQDGERRRIVGNERDDDLAAEIACVPDRVGRARRDCGWSLRHDDEGLEPPVRSSAGDDGHGHAVQDEFDPGDIQVRCVRANQEQFARAGRGRRRGDPGNGGCHRVRRLEGGNKGRRYRVPGRVGHARDGQRVRGIPLEVLAHRAAIRGRDHDHGVPQDPINLARDSTGRTAEGDARQARRIDRLAEGDPHHTSDVYLDGTVGGAHLRHDGAVLVARREGRHDGLVERSSGLVSHATDDVAGYQAPGVDDEGVERRIEKRTRIERHELAVRRERHARRDHVAVVARIVGVARVRRLRERLEQSEARDFRGGGTGARRHRNRIEGLREEYGDHLGGRHRRLTVVGADRQDGGRVDVEFEDHRVDRDVVGVADLTLIIDPSPEDRSVATRALRDDLERNVQRDPEELERAARVHEERGAQAACAEGHPRARDVQPVGVLDQSRDGGHLLEHQGNCDGGSGWRELSGLDRIARGDDAARDRRLGHRGIEPGAGDADEGRDATAGFRDREATTEDSDAVEADLDGCPGHGTLDVHVDADGAREIDVCDRYGPVEREATRSGPAVAGRHGAARPRPDREVSQGNLVEGVSTELRPRVAGLGEPDLTAGVRQRDLGVRDEAVIGVADQAFDAPASLELDGDAGNLAFEIDPALRLAGQAIERDHPHREGAAGNALELEGSVGIRRHRLAHGRAAKQVYLATTDRRRTVRAESHALHAAKRAQLDVRDDELLIEVHSGARAPGAGRGGVEAFQGEAADRHPVEAERPGFVGHGECRGLARRPQLNLGVGDRRLAVGSEEGSRHDPS